jgi:hypothetical protein
LFFGVLVLKESMVFQKGCSGDSASGEAIRCTYELDGSCDARDQPEPIVETEGITLAVHN